MALQTVRFSLGERKCNSIKSSSFLKPFVYSKRPQGAITALSSNSFYLTEGSCEGRDKSESEKEEKNLKPFKCKERFYRVPELMAPKRFKRPFTSIQVPGFCLLDDIGKHYGITVVRS